MREHVPRPFTPQEVDRTLIKLGLEKHRRVENGRVIYHLSPEIVRTACERNGIDYDQVRAKQLAIIDCREYC